MWTKDGAVIGDTNIATGTDTALVDTVAEYTTESGLKISSRMTRHTASSGDIEQNGTVAKLKPYFSIKNSKLDDAGHYRCYRLVRLLNAPLTVAPIQILIAETIIQISRKLFFERICYNILILSVAFFSL